jgi:hypothetical protein
MAADWHKEAVMNSKGRPRTWLLIPLVLTILAWTAVLPAAASASNPSPNSEPCPGASAALHLGTATPVLLIHGFSEDPGVFTGEGSPTLESAISSAFPGAVKVVTFDYRKWSHLWVTFTLVGPQLAKCISWLAHISAQQKGPGQVIIVAHSMGGLAVRCAVDPTCASGQAADPSLIGLVITLGTPNTGSQPQSMGPVLDTVCTAFSWCNDLLILRDSPAAQAMTPGSSDLAKLPLLPITVPVDAIAGRITVTTNLFGYKYVLKDLGDVIVPVSSALADAKQGALHDGPGANKTTVNCGTVSVTQLPSWIKESTSKLAPAPPVTCWHLTETTDALWQGDITAAIKAALQGLCMPAAINAALAAKDPTSATKRTLVTYACVDRWAVAEVHQPLTLSDGSVVQDTGFAILKKTDSGWSSEGLSDGTCLAAPDSCPGVSLPPRAVLHLLLQESGIKLTSVSAPCTSAALTTALDAQGNQPGGWKVLSFACQSGYSFASINPVTGGEEVVAILQQQGSAWKVLYTGEGLCLPPGQSQSMCKGYKQPMPIALLESLMRQAGYLH